MDPEVGGIYIPRLSTLLADKLSSLRGAARIQFQEMVGEYDQEVEKQCQTIQSTLDRIVEKMQEMKDLLGATIDHVAANQVDQPPGAGQGDNPIGIKLSFTCIFSRLF